MNSKLETSIERFLRKTFESNPSYNNLTKAALRADYMKENNVTEFSKKEKKLFSNTVNKIIVEFADAIEASKEHAGLNEKPQTELHAGDSMMNGCNTNGRSSSDEKMDYNSDADSDSDALVIDESAPTVSKSVKEDVEKKECSSHDPIPNSKNEIVDEHSSKEILSSESDISEKDMNIAKKAKKSSQVKRQALDSSLSDAEIDEIGSDTNASIESHSSDEKENVISDLSSKNQKQPTQEPESKLPTEGIKLAEKAVVDISEDDDDVNDEILKTEQKCQASETTKTKLEENDVKKEECLSLDPVPSNEDEELDDHPSKELSSCDSDISEKLVTVTTKNKKSSQKKRKALDSSLSDADVDESSSNVDSSVETHRSKEKENIISNKSSKKRKQPTRELKSKVPTKRIKLEKKAVDISEDENGSIVDDDDDDVNDKILKKKRKANASKQANSRSEKKNVEKEKCLSLDPIPSSDDEEVDEHPSKEISSSDSDISEKPVNITKKSQKSSRVKRQALDSSLSNADIDSDVNSSIENHPPDEKENSVSNSSSKKRKQPTREPKSKLPAKQIKLAKKAVDDTSEEDDDGSSGDDDISNEVLKKKKKSQASKPTKTNLKSNGKQVQKKAVNKVLSSEEDEEESTDVKKSKKTKTAVKGSKNSSAMTAKIERLKKYIRTAGLRIPSYDKVFESCKSMKSKADKLLEILKNEGIEGRPTLEKCKKLKKKIEQKKEVESLDMSLIINTNQGRPKRNVRSLYVNTRPAEEDNDSNHSAEKIYSRLKAIADSDDSS